MLNRVVLIGRLVRDPESSYTGSGIPVAKMRIAVDRFSRNPETNERETDFIDIVAWRKTADFVREYLGKGRLIAVDGRLQVRSWTAQDGTKRWSTEVIADSVQGLDRPRDAGPSDGPPEPPGFDTVAGEPAQQSTAPRPAPVGDKEEDDPFAE